MTFFLLVGRCLFIYVTDSIVCCCSNIIINSPHNIIKSVRGHSRTGSSHSDLSIYILLVVRQLTRRNHKNTNTQRAAGVYTPHTPSHGWVFHGREHYFLMLLFFAPFRSLSDCCLCRSLFVAFLFRCRCSSSFFVVVRAAFSQKGQQDKKNNSMHACMHALFSHTSIYYASGVGAFL